MNNHNHKKHHTSQEQPIDKKKIVEEVLNIFPLLSKDHFLYSTLERFNWDVNASLDILQKRYTQLENEQFQIEKKLEVDRDTKDKEAKHKAMERKMVDSFKDIFGANTFSDEYYYKILRDYQYNNENCTNFFIRELELRAKHAEQDAIQQRLKDEAKAQEEALKRQHEEELKRVEEKRKQQEEEVKRFFAEKARAEEEMLKAQELRRQAEEARRLEELKRRKEEEERQRQAEEVRRQLEEAQRKADEVQRKAEEERIARAQKILEERRQLEIQLEEQKKRLEEILEKKKMDQQKKKEYTDRLNNILLELKNQDEDQKREVANSQIFQDLIKDFNKFVNVSSIIEDDKKVEVQQPNQQPSQQPPYPIFNPQSLFRLPQPSQQPQPQPQSYPFMQYRPNYQPQQQQPQVYNGSPFQNISTHPFYQQQTNASYNPFTDQKNQNSPLMSTPHQQPQQQQQIVHPKPPPTPSAPSTVSFQPNSNMFMHYKPQPPQQYIPYIAPTLPLPQPQQPAQQVQLPTTPPNPPVAQVIVEPSQQRSKAEAKALLISNLKSMFPNQTEEIIECILSNAENDIDVAIQKLLALNQ